MYPCVCVFACLCLPTLAVQSSKKQYNPIAMSMLSAHLGFQYHSPLKRTLTPLKNG